MEFEKLKDKLLKLQELAERGEYGEAQNAKRAIERLCAQYRVDVKELLAEKKKRYKIKTGRGLLNQRLFAQCYFRVTNNTSMPYSQLDRSTILIELTSVEYIDLCNMYEWHKKNFEEELEKQKEGLMQAYLSKHDLFSSNGTEPDDDKPLTKEELESIRRAINIAETLGDNVYCKMIEK